MRKVKIFPKDKAKEIIIWNTRKIQSFFNNKDKVNDYSCVIFRGICSCGADFTGEKIRNCKIRWNEHITGKDRNLDCVKHLNHNFDLEF